MTRNPQTRSVRPACRATCAATLFLLLRATSVPPAEAQAQFSGPDSVDVPFAQWISEAAPPQIPWKVSVKPVGLSVHQRLGATIEVRILGEEIAKRSADARLFVLVQMKDAAGGSYRNAGKIGLEGAGEVSRSNEVQYLLDALVLPGEYRVEVALYDPATREHSAAVLPLRVDALKDDPLPSAWRGLPPVEFLNLDDAPDKWFRPEIAGHLHLPLETRRPVHIELLLNPTPSETTPPPGAGIKPRVSTPNLAELIPALKVMSQVGAVNGSLDVAVLDLDRHRVSFEQAGVYDLDWVRLRAALAASDPNVIDVAALQGRKQNAAFFRAEMERRIADRTQGSGESRAEPLRVFVVLGSPTGFDPAADLHAIEREGDCNCRVFYISYQHPRDETEASERSETPQPFPRGRGGREGSYSPGPRNQLDYLEGILKPLHPRVFRVQSPRDFRKALAAMLDEISKM